MTNKAMILVTLGLGLVACSQQQVYDAARHDAQLSCQELPQAQYQACMAEVTESYDTYSRKRDELIGEQ